MDNSLMVRYESDGKEIVLTKDDVKKYLVTGDADKVTDKEFKLFMELCKAQGLNPFLKEAYLIKYGNDANIITGKDVFLKRARSNSDFKGFKAGIIIQNKDGFEKREGTFYIKGKENLVGGWADVYIKDWEVPFEHSVSLDEFNKGTATWKSMPAVMIRKVALVQALREAFPNDLSQLYSAEEIELPKPKYYDAYDNMNEYEAQDVLLGGDWPRPISSGASTVDEKEEYASDDKITRNQQSRMFAIAKGDNNLVKAVMERYGYKGSSSDVKKTDYNKICDEIEAGVKAIEEDLKNIDKELTEI